MYIMVAGARDRYLIKGSEPWISWFAYLSLCGVFIDICRLMAFPSNGEVSIRTYLNRLIKGWVGHGDGWGPQFGIGVAGDLTFRICSCCGEMACPRVGVVFLSLHLWKKLLPLLTNNFCLGCMYILSLGAIYLFRPLFSPSERFVCLFGSSLGFGISWPGGLQRLMGLQALLSLILVSL